MGHARALLGLPKLQEMVELARAGWPRRLSVRETERWSSSARSRAARRAKEQRPERPRPAGWSRICSARLGTKVRLTDRGGGEGTLEVDFFCYEDLDRILALIRSRLFDGE